MMRCVKLLLALLLFSTSSYGQYYEYVRYLSQPGTNTGMHYNPIPSTLNNGLLAYWPLNEESGTREDVINNYDFTPSGSILANDFCARSLCPIFLDDTGYAYETTIKPGLTGNGVSFVFWIRRPSNPSALAAPVSSYQSANPAFQFRVSSSGLPNLYVRDGDGTLIVIQPGSGYSLADDKYHLVIMTYNENGDRKLHLYIPTADYELISAATGTSNYLRDDGGGILIGRGGGGTYPWAVGGIFSRVDELGIWDRCLTADERREIYTRGAGKFYPFINSDKGISYPYDTPPFASYWPVSNYKISSISYYPLAFSALNNIIYYWSMDETVSPRYDNIRRFALNDYIVVYPTGSGNGRFYWSVYFDGGVTPSQYLVGYTPEIIDASNGLTVASWVAYDASSMVYNFTMGQDFRVGGTGLFYMYCGNSGCRTTVQSTTDPFASDVTTDYSYIPDAQHFVVGIYNPTTMKAVISIDGNNFIESETALTSHPIFAVDSNRQVIIGSDSLGASYSYGTVDEVFIFQKALTIDEVRWLHNISRPFPF